MPRDRIAPLGRTLLHGEAGKPTTAVGLPSPKGVPWRGRRGNLRWRAAATGGLAAHGGVVSAAGGATFGRSGGARRAEAGAGGRKSRTRGGSGGPGGVRGRRGPGQNRGQPGLHPGARRAKNGRRRGKTGRSGGQKAGLAGAGGAKSPLFLPQTGRRRAVRAGNWREKLAACVGLSGHVQGIFGRFRRKRLGLRKSPYTRI